MLDSLDANKAATATQVKRSEIIINNVDSNAIKVATPLTWRLLIFATLAGRQHRRPIDARGQTDWRRRVTNELATFALFAHLMVN